MRAAVVACVIALGAMRHVRAEEEYDRRITERRIATLDGSAQVKTFICSEDRRHVAFVKKTGDWKQTVVVDGTETGTYDHVYRMAFSPDGARFACAVNIEGKAYLVLDGQRSRAYRSFMTCPLIFSPDGKHLAYGISENNIKVNVVADDITGLAYDEIGSLELTPNGKPIYLATKGEGKRVLVHEGTELGGGDDEVVSYACAPSGDGIAYAVKTNAGKYSVVRDGKPGRTYDGVRDLCYSPDGKRLAYKAQLAPGKQVVVVDGEEGPPCSAIGVPYISFSPDSQSVAYMARWETQWSVVINGKKGAEYDELKDLELFSHSSGEVADALRTPVVFSADGKRSAYCGQRDKRWYSIVDGKESPCPGDHFVCTPLFRLDGRQIAFVVKKEDRYHVVVDGKPGAELDGLFPDSLTFSPGGDLLVYAAAIARKGGKRKFTVAVNGKFGHTYDGVISREALGSTFSVDSPRSVAVFDGPMKFHYLAFRSAEKGIDVLLVEETVERVPAPGPTSTPP